MQASPPESRPAPAPATWFEVVVVRESRGNAVARVTNHTDDLAEEEAWFSRS